MTTRPDRFSTALSDLIVTPAESDRDRADAFLEPFHVGRSGGVFTDPRGYPLAVSPRWVDGLDRFSADELRAAASAIARPSEIRIVWKRGSDGAPLLTRRYIAEDIAVDVNRAGWCFATSDDGGFDAARLRAGELVWRASSQI